MSVLYTRLCDTIMGKIADGSLRVGDRLPPEAEYAATLGVSRSTLRKAYAELEAAGVLTRRKRAGTQIIADTPRQRFRMATTGLQELLSLGRDTTLAITGTRRVGADMIAPLAELGARQDWLEVSGTRTLAGETTPFSVNRVYVPARFAGIEPLLAAQETSVFQAIETQFGVRVARVSQTVRAIPCPAAEARAMGLAEGAPVLQIDAQLYLHDGTLMEISVATFDPDRFAVHTDVQIDGA